VPDVNAATSQVLSTESPVEHGQRTASCDTSLVVSGHVDCERRRRNVYDKKPQRYTARSDKSVAYVTIALAWLQIRPASKIHLCIHKM